MEKIKVLVAEDHAVVREGLREVINREADMEVVGEAGNGEEAVRLVNELRPNVVLMDIAMPGLNGIEATRQIKESLPHTCILVLTAYDNPEFIFAVIEAGAAGYLLKNVKGKELVNAIRAINVGESVLHPAVAQTPRGEKSSRMNADFHGFFLLHFHPCSSVLIREPLPGGRRSSYCSSWPARTA